ncbi:hypothetical protein H4F69_15535 [Pectobacterium brasiliense]|nr:hypothetical protein [Pectobacterium brasiliense]MBN3174960.1 hypothetical protein [Pectobacterium brasiliense]
MTDTTKWAADTQQKEGTERFQRYASNGPQGDGQGCPAKKTSGTFFNVAQATARRVTDKDVRHKKIQKRFHASGFL